MKVPSIYHKLFAFDFKLAIVHSVIMVISYLCDPAPLNGALWGGNLWERYTNVISTFWCKNDYSAIFLSKVTNCWTLPCTISFKTILQRCRLSKIAIYVYFYGIIKKQMFHNTYFLSYFHLKSVCNYCIWYDEYLGRIYQKWTIFNCTAKSLI